MSVTLPLALALLLVPDALLAQNAADPQAVAEVAAGRRAVANAAWWGFDAGDSTAALQAAIDSKAKTVIVPYMGEPWIVRPVRLRGDQEIRFEPGVLILAKKGEFQGAGDSLFTATDVANLVLRGYGATLRMRKSDYQNPPYKKAEWRMGIAVRGCRNVLIEGLRVESTGGDGFYVDGSGKLRWSEDVTIRNSVAHDNHRQGVSVISAVNLLIENSVFSGTSGTAPEAGIDFEPDVADQRLVNCVVRNSVFESNRGHSILVYLKPLTRASEPVSIRFENCLARAGGTAGIAVGAVRDDGPRGLVEFRDTVTEGMARESVRIYDKSAASAQVRFVNCSWSGAARSPVELQLRDAKAVGKLGGIDFVDCHIYDSADRPAVVAADSVSDLRGRIFLHNPAARPAQLGDLKLVPAR